jgi:hypothetical protein
VSERLGGSRTMKSMNMLRPLTIVGCPVYVPVEFYHGGAGGGTVECTLNTHEGLHREGLLCAGTRMRPTATSMGRLVLLRGIPGQV